ncbi:MAG: hypothetical protein WCP01_13865 [Methylococcaceae bacterium]
MKYVFKDLLIPIAKPILSKVHRYKDIHRGESCYIMGGGISLKWFDLAEFTGKTTINLALFPFHNDFNKLNVSYSVLTEPWWFYPFFKTASKGYIKNYLQIAYRDVIEKYPDKEFFINLSNYPVLKNKNITYLFRDLYDPKLTQDFISRRINACHGAFRTAILLAIYMGFDHIYLVGCDYTHVPSRSLHWFEKGQGILYPQGNYQKEYFEIAKEFIDITTITLDGTSDFINAVTYKEYTGREPIYRENTELVNERYLKLLDTWPGYSIY